MNAKPNLTEWVRRRKELRELEAARKAARYERMVEHRRDYALGVVHSKFVAASEGHSKLAGKSFLFMQMQAEGRA